MLEVSHGLGMIQDSNLQELSIRNLCCPIMDGDIDFIAEIGIIIQDDAISLKSDAFLVVDSIYPS